MGKASDLPSRLSKHSNDIVAYLMNFVKLTPFVE